MSLALELVGRFEQHLAEAVESLLTQSLRVPGNPEGYVLFREGSIRATLSTNPSAGWATQTYGIGGQSGLRHIGFHTILWSPLPLTVEPSPPIEIREVSTQEEMEAHIDIQLGAYDVPADVIDRLRRARPGFPHALGHDRNVDGGALTP